MKEQKNLHGIFPILDADEKNRDLDIIFIHGLNGHAEKTWGKKNENFWLEWFSEDFENIAVWTVGYDATPSAWLGETMPIQDRAYDILDDLSSINGIGQRPIVFVVHSMGGLILKYMIDISQRDPEYKYILTHTKGISFIAVPHEGSEIADYLSVLSKVFRLNSIVKQLKSNSTDLTYLDDAFINIAKVQKIKCISFFERNEVLRPKKKMFGITLHGKGIKVVSELSARGRFEQPRPYGISKDHITICKLNSKRDKVYKKTKLLIQAVLDEPLNKTHHENNTDKKLLDIEKSLPEKDKTPSTINQIFLVFNDSKESDKKYHVLGYIQANDEFDNELIEFTFEDINKEEEQKVFLKKIIGTAALDNVPIHFIIPPALFLINFKQWKYKDTALVQLYHIILHSQEKFTRNIGRYNNMIDKWDCLYQILKDADITDALLLTNNNSERFDRRANKMGMYFNYFQSDYNIMENTLTGAHIGLWQYPSGTLSNYQVWIKRGCSLNQLNDMSSQCDHMALLWDDMSLLKNLKIRK